MTKTAKTVALVVLVLTVLGGAGMWLSRGSSSKAKVPQVVSGASAASNPGSATTSALELLPTDLLTVKPQVMVQAIPMTGTLRAINTTLAKTKVAGDLQQLLVREGQAVTQGQVIAKIDPTEYDLRVKDRQAQLQSTQAALDQARRAFDNNRKLKEQGFISQTGFDNTQSALDIAKANHDSAIANLNLARRNLEDTVIRATMAGLVGERFAQQGEKLATDGRILSIVDTRSMELEASVPANQIAQVKIGAQVSVSVEGMADRLQGQVVRISPATQSGTRSIPVYVQVDNPGGSARAGMFASARLELSRTQDALMVPATALLQSDSKASVLVVQNNQLSQVPVVIGATDQSGIEPMVHVTSGLAAGVVLLRQPGANAVAGLNVQVTQPAQQRAAVSAQPPSKGP